MLAGASMHPYNAVHAVRDRRSRSTRRRLAARHRRASSTSAGLTGLALDRRARPLRSGAAARHTCTLASRAGADWHETLEARSSASSTRRSPGRRDRSVPLLRVAGATAFFSGSRTTISSPAAIPSSRCCTRSSTHARDSLPLAPPPLLYPPTQRALFARTRALPARPRPPAGAGAQRRRTRAAALSQHEDGHNGFRSSGSTAAHLAPPARRGQGVGASR